RVQRRGIGQDVRTSAIAPHTERDDMRMLDEQQQIARAPGAPIFHERPLHRERLRIWNQAETPDLESPHYGAVLLDPCRLNHACDASQLSSVRFTSDMN